jgi:hypothetical protein
MELYILRLHTPACRDTSLITGDNFTFYRTYSSLHVSQKSGGWWLGWLVGDYLLLKCFGPYEIRLCGCVYLLLWIFRLFLTGNIPAPL